MITDHEPAEVIRRLVQWADGQEGVRALLLTSSRANPDAPVDIFSDYDVLLVVADIAHSSPTDRGCTISVGCLSPIGIRSSRILSAGSSRWVM